MIKKTYVISVIERMPEDATLGQIARWVDLLDLLGTADVDAVLEQDMTSFFAKERQKNKAGKKLVDAFAGVSAKEKSLSIIRKLPEDVAVSVIVNRLALLKKVAEALAESERGEWVEHDTFFDQLESEDEEENQSSVADAGTKGSAGHKRRNRQGRTTNGATVHRTPKKSSKAS